MNKQRIVAGMAFVALISAGLSIPNMASARDDGHHKVKKERVEHKRNRQDRDHGHKKQRVGITSKKIKKVHMDHNPRRHDRHGKSRRGHAYGHHHRPRHSHGRHLGWYLDRHHRHGHPKKWHKMRKHQRRHHYERRDYRYNNDGRIRFHIEYSDWL